MKFSPPSVHSRRTPPPGLQLLEVSYHACFSDSAATAARVAAFLKHETLETAKMTAAVDRSLHHIQGKIDSGV